MIVHPAPQGSKEWVRARLGIPTASSFDRLITAKTRKPSSQADGYCRELLAEWALGCPLEDFSSGMMERGSEMEAEAVRWYELQRDVTTTPVGLCLRDDEKVGASPDRLVGVDGLLEIKCCNPKAHVGLLLGDSAEDAHRCQVQGQLLITGRAWADLLCYHPDLPPALIRIERDEEFLSALSAAVEGFLVKLEAGRERLRALGVEPPPEEPSEPDFPNDEPTPEQIAAFDRYLAGADAQPVETRHGPDLSDPSSLPF